MRIIERALAHGKIPVLLNTTGLCVTIVVACAHCSYVGHLDSRIKRSEQKIIRGRVRKRRVEKAQLADLLAEAASRIYGQEQRQKQREEARIQDEKEKVARMKQMVNERNAGLILQRQREASGRF